MNILQRKFIFQVFSIVFFFSAIALVTYFVAQTILIRRRKTDKSSNGQTRTSRGFSPSDFIPSDVLPFSLDRDETNFDMEKNVSPETRQVDEVMSAELRIKRAIVRMEVALDELTSLGPEHYPNPEINDRILIGIFNFMKKKTRFMAWLEVFRVCMNRASLERLFKESFEYVVHSLPKVMEEQPKLFENLSMTEMLEILIRTVKATPEFEELANNRVFHFYLVDFDMLMAPPLMMRRSESLKQFLQLAYYTYMLGITCSFVTEGLTPDKYIMNSLEKETHRALAMLRFDFDLWGRLTATSRALEFSQRKDIDFASLNLAPESQKAAKLINEKIDL